MALKRNLALMALTTFARLSAGLISFSILARLLGLEAFGILMLWLSVGTLLSLFANYGLTTYVLRKIGANPEVTESLMSEGFTAKLILTGILLIGVTAVVASTGPNDPSVLLILLVGCILDTFTEFLNAGFRARDKFATETTISTVFSFLHAAIVAGAVYWHPTAMVAALAYTVSRSTVLGVTILLTNDQIAPLKIAPLKASISLLRDAVSYACDFGMQSLFGQIDSLVLNHFLGPSAVGLYQAGMRLFLGGLQAGPILANVFLPKAAAESSKNFRRISNQIHACFLCVGIMFGLALAIAAEPLVSVMFGPAFNKLVPLLPYFGFLLYLRFAAAAWGVILTATGQQTFRTMAGVVQWLVIAICAVFLVPNLGIKGWLISLCVGTSLLGLGYAYRARSRAVNLGPVITATVAGGLCFAPYL